MCGVSFKSQLGWCLFRKHQKCHTVIGEGMVDLQLGFRVVQLRG